MYRDAGESLLVYKIDALLAIRTWGIIFTCIYVAVANLVHFYTTFSSLQLPTLFLPNIPFRPDCFYDHFCIFHFPCSSCATSIIGMISLSRVGLVLMIRNILLWLSEEEVRSTSRKSQIPLHHRLFVSAYGHKRTAVTNPQSLLGSLYSLNSCSYNYQIQNKVKQRKMRRQYFVCTLRTQRINHLGILLLLLQPYTLVYTI